VENIKGVNIKVENIKGVNIKVEKSNKAENFKVEKSNKAENFKVEHKRCNSCVLQSSRALNEACGSREEW